MALLRRFRVQFLFRRPPAPSIKHGIIKLAFHEQTSISRFDPNRQKEPTSIPKVELNPPCVPRKINPSSPKLHLPPPLQPSSGEPLGWCSRVLALGRRDAMAVCGCRVSQTGLSITNQKYVRKNVFHRTNGERGETHWKPMTTSTMRDEGLATAAYSGETTPHSSCTPTTFLQKNRGGRDREKRNREGRERDEHKAAKIIRRWGGMERRNTHTR